MRGVILARVTPGLAVAGAFGGVLRMQHPTSGKSMLYGCGQADLFAAMEECLQSATLRVEPPSRMRRGDALVSLEEHSHYTQMVEGATEGCYWALLSAGPVPGKPLAGARYVETTVRILNQTTWDVQAGSKFGNYGVDTPFALTASAADLARNMATSWELMAVLLSLMGGIDPDFFPPVPSAGSSPELLALTQHELDYRARYREMRGGARRPSPGRVVDAIKKMAPGKLAAVEAALAKAKARAATVAPALGE